MGRSLIPPGLRWAVRKVPGTSTGPQGGAGPAEPGTPTGYNRGSTTVQMLH
jgi:hypothetical protein